MKGLIQIGAAIDLISRAQSERSLKVGGEKLKEGLLNMGQRTIEFLIAKMTMKNVASAKAEVLRNVTPRPMALPQPTLPDTSVSGALMKSGELAFSEGAPSLPAIAMTTEDATFLLSEKC